MSKGRSIVLIALCVLLYASLAVHGAARSRGGGGGGMTYDRHQEGDVNVQADLQNIVLVFAPMQRPQPPKPSAGTAMFDSLVGLLQKKEGGGKKKEADEQDVALENLEERASPYRVDITQERRSQIAQ